MENQIVQLPPAPPCRRSSTRRGNVIESNAQKWHPVSAGGIPPQACPSSGQHNKGSRSATPLSTSFFSRGTPDEEFGALAMPSLSAGSGFGVPFLKNTAAHLRRHPWPLAGVERFRVHDARSGQGLSAVLDACRVA